MDPKSTRKGRMSKRKGSNFELTCCKLLKDWWGGDFKRVPLSGGWDKSVMTGDIFRTLPDGNIDNNFPFSIECKKQEGWTFTQLFKQTGPVRTWWKQCSEEALIRNRAPILIFAKNNCNPLVMFPHSLLGRGPVRVIGALPTHLETDQGEIIMLWSKFTGSVVKTSVSSLIEDRQLASEALYAV